MMFSGDLLFAGSIGRTDLPGGDHARCCAAWRPGCCRSTTGSSCCPGHGQQTTIGRERATNPYLPTCPSPPPRGRDDEPSRPRCRGFPSSCPASAPPSWRSSTRCAGPSSCTASPRSRPARSSRSTSCCARARPTRRSTSCAGCRPTPTATTPGWGCTSTSPCRSRGTCSRTPASSSSRSAATRSRSAGAASGRRRAATASSPRPTSTSSAATSSASTPTSRSPRSWPRR